MKPTDKTDRSQTDALTFEFDLPHAPKKVWRALTDPELLTQWLLPVTGFSLEPGAAFTFNTQPQPGWDGAVNCKLLESRELELSLVGQNLLDRRHGEIVPFQLPSEALQVQRSLYVKAKWQF